MMLLTLYLSYCCCTRPVITFDTHFDLPIVRLDVGRDEFIVKTKSSCSEHMNLQPILAYQMVLLNQDLVNDYAVISI